MDVNGNSKLKRLFESINVLFILELEVINAMIATNVSPLQMLSNHTYNAFIAMTDRSNAVNATNRMVRRTISNYTSLQNIAPVMKNFTETV